MNKCPECKVEQRHKMDCSQGRRCACPRCNCFADMVHVPTTGTYLVLPGGRVREVFEAEWLGGDDLGDGYRVWVTNENE